LSVRAQDRNAYQELFRLRQVEKTYEAIAGAPETSPRHPKFPLVHRSMMVEDSQFFRMCEVASHEHQEPAEFNSETWIDCVERLPTDFDRLEGCNVHSRVLAKYVLKPITGQRHQLRVHMNALGLPLINDPLYPSINRGPDEAENFHCPLQLLAKRVSFEDPNLRIARTFVSQFKLSC
jgi:tRNA pseudouridine32 synthase/23S rRNA pseudouridine746 synthase